MVFRRHSQFQALARQNLAENVRTVGIIHRPHARGAGEELVLPGYMQAYVESSIYARTSGYLKTWYHESEAGWKGNDLLADIDTPEVDQQLIPAKADLVTAQANEQLSLVTEARTASSSSLERCRSRMRTMPRVTSRPSPPSCIPPRPMSVA